VSGPVSTDDVPATPGGEGPKACEIEVLDGRAARVGAFGVTRVLPRRARRTVGAWCFADQMGPGRVGPERGLDIGPHPHIGLQTVTWLLDGQVLHRDSLGSEQLIRPGQVNLMTAGHGVAHSEETAGVRQGDLHGIQLWVAQPEATRNGPPAFEHHANLPQAEIDGAVATVLVGDFAGARSPARRDTAHMGVDLALPPGRATLPLDPGYEHAIVVARGAVAVGSTTVGPGHLGYLGLGRDELAVEALEASRILLIGGIPLADQLLMWWNYVARTRDEVLTAHDQWTAGDDRFGEVASPLARIDVDPPPWT
jgi:redox-sensitive bicupin YhaK (pirin superfamily)